MIGTLTIITENRGEGYIAYLKGSPETWDSGKTRSQAVGELMFTYAARRDGGIAIEHKAVPDGR